ncbi:MAG TPA: FkbM family methyltransferase [Pyrinomonadaceae bacterium]|nr:FkbM family methyltransferase [Pyrinomonadaceae bacterium]
MKLTYERLIKTGRVETFFDIGSNVGLHSLLLLVHGIQVVSFEPNPACHIAFREACKLNNVIPDIQSLALADKAGEAKLFFPDQQTDLGTTAPQTSAYLREYQNIKEITVPKITLDTFLADTGHRPDLIKIDTEGNELDVLKGARRALGEMGPTIIFESWPGYLRAELFKFLTEADYLIHNLSGEALTEGGFANSLATNFLARPA